MRDKCPSSASPVTETYEGKAEWNKNVHYQDKSFFYIFCRNRFQRFRLGKKAMLVQGTKLITSKGSETSDSHKLRFVYSVERNTK